MRKTIPPQVRTASFAPASVSDEQRTVDVVFSTGAQVKRYDWWRDESFLEELSLEPGAVRLDRLNSGAPFLSDHYGSIDNAIGVVVRGSARVQDGVATATIRFAKAGLDERADRTFAKIKDGILTSVSVGYRTHKVERITAKEKGQPDVVRATDWEPYEISVVAMPADAKAQFRTAGIAENEVEIITRAGMEPEHNGGRNVEQNEVKDPKPATPAPAVDLEAVRAEAQKVERERVAGINHAVRVSKLGAEFGEKLIADGVSLDAARKLVLDELAKRSEAIETGNKPPVFEVGETAREKFVRGATAWLLDRTGAARDVKAAQALKTAPKGLQGVDAEGGGEFRGMTLLDLARHCLTVAGVSTRGLTVDQTFKLALTARSPYSAIADFPVLLENVMNKSLLAAYAITPDVWRQFVKVVTVADFRDANFYRTGSFGTLDSLGENDEYKLKGIPDGAKTSINVATKGNLINVSRQLLINDDMGALNDLITKLGRAAALSIEVDFFALLALNSGAGPTIAGNPMFHSSRGNIGTASAISTAAFDADRTLMRAYKDISGNDYLDVRPSLLLLAPGQYAAAKVVNNSAYDHDGTKMQKPNSVQGLFRDIIDSPRISGTKRYMFVDPQVIPAFVCAFLEGSGEAPTFESKDGWNVDGAEMKVRLDYKVQPFDPLGALYNAGA